MINLSTSSTDPEFMRMAIACAQEGVGYTRPNPPVGAVVIGNDGIVIGRGFHHKAGGPHAEVNAIADCGDADLSQATLYVTLEPCSTTGRTPPCTDLIIRKCLKRVVVGCIDPNPKHAGRGIQILRESGIDVTTDVCGAECRRLIEPFSSVMLKHRPHLTLKLAMSLDGRIADRHGRSKWITGEESRSFVQNLRRNADAILVGSNTAIADNPQLTCHLPGVTQNAWRIVADSRGRTHADSVILNDEFASRTIIATTDSGAKNLSNKLPASCLAKIWILPVGADNHIDLSVLIHRLTSELNVMELLCEGGGVLAGSLLKAGIIDRLVAFYAPIIIGDTARPAFASFDALLQDTTHFIPEDIKVFGRDTMLTFVAEN